MGDLAFRARREVVVLDGQEAFRVAQSEGVRRTYVHGDALGGEPGEPADGQRVADRFGRFVLLTHDPERRTLTIQTDRHGLVPFYRARSGERLFLSTRIRPLVERGGAEARLDESTLADFLALQIPIGTKTLLEGVAAVESGVRTTIHLDTLECTEIPEWDPAALLREPGVPFEELRDELVSRFLDAAADAMGAAEPVGVTLSGGMDTRCNLAAALELGRTVEAWHVSVPGSRAELYTRRLAEHCGVPLHAFQLDAAFAAEYHGRISRMVELSEGMKLVPQPEMLWLRDQVKAGVVLHGAFGELAKLRVLRDFRLEGGVADADRASLADVLWRERFEVRFRRALRMFAPEFRARLEPHPRADLTAALGAADPDLGVPEALQLVYFRHWIRSARHLHQIWNARVATRAPFLHPAFVDLLLRVRTEDRLDPRFQVYFLEKIHPTLARLPDENTGAAARAGATWTRMIRFLDLMRRILLGSQVEAGHGDPVTCISHMQPRPEDILHACGDEGRYDHAALAGMIQRVRRAHAARGARRGALLRGARLDATTLQTFFAVEAARRWMASLRAGPGSRAQLE
jgi:asparagine synthetase B (glutamine-hydrolysing)